MPIEARRHSPRVKLGGTAYVIFGSGIRAVVRDISDGGLGFSSTSPIQSGRQIRFRLPSSNKSGDKYEVVADIAWNDDSRTRGGLRFKTVPAEVRSELQAWMDQLSFSAGPFSAETSDWQGTGANFPSERSVSLEVTGLGPEVARSRQSDERIAAAAVEILAEERTEQETGVRAMDDPVTLESKPTVQDEVTATSTVPFGSFSHAAPGETESELTMFPLEPTPTGGYTFSSRAQRSRRNLLAVAAVILMCGVGASAAALWYVYPSQTRYEVQRVQERVARLIAPRSGSERKQSTSNVEPASIGSVPDNGFAGAIPEGAAAAPDITGTRPAGGFDSALKTQDSRKGNSPPSETSNAELRSDIGASQNNDSVRAARSAEPSRNESNTELALARTYLEGDSSPDRKTKAVQLLWLATEKGNIDAEIQLADLYANGEDVPKSCVQARILLKAAQIADPSAAEQKLKELDQTGCS